MPTEHPIVAPDVVRVDHLFLDIEQPGKIVLSEQIRILGAQAPGCWYINPMFRVWSDQPTPEFFKEVRKCQGAYFRQLRLSLGNNGWRTLRRIDQRQAKEENFDGCLIIHGQAAEMTDRPLLESCLGYRPSVQVRPEAFRMLKEQNLEGLRGLMVKAHEEVVTSEPLTPDNAYVILPAATIRSRFASKEFFQEAEKRAREWQRKIDHISRRKLLTREFRALLVHLPICSSEEAKQATGRDADRSSLS